MQVTQARTGYTEFLETEMIGGCLPCEGLPPSFKREILNNFPFPHLTILSQFQHPSLHHYNKLCPTSGDRRIIRREWRNTHHPNWASEVSSYFCLWPLGISCHHSSHWSQEHLNVAKWLRALFITLAPRGTPWYFLGYSLCRFIHQQRFTESLLYTRHPSQRLGKSSERKQKNLCSGGASILVEKSDNSKLVKHVWRW